ncbi:lactate utilization protein [Candidatus Bathyarchaeota archaeon]|nr:lactate utilization protein [Candidatus Bathyarchaeota archaeon]
MSEEKNWEIELKQSVDWFIEEKTNRTVEALKKNGFDSFYVSTKAMTLERMLQLIPKGSRVGIAGSMTIRQIGLDDALRKRGDQVDDIWAKKYSMEEQLAVRRRHFDADVFLTSSNAITEDGKLINIDGLGNRVAAMVFGPKKVIIVAGINKIVKDVESGIRRIREVSAPMNVKRFSGETPCTRDGHCDLQICQPPDRHCHILSIIEKRPMKTDTTVVLVGENLGY